METARPFGSEDRGDLPCPTSYLVLLLTLRSRWTVLDLLAELAARADVRGVILERDSQFPPDAELNAELDAIAAAVARGAARRVPVAAHYAILPRSKHVPVR